ncbi:MAG: FMN-binding protein [Clostridia bacterium]|nr:FMN-binding protein [Clostridia bacterium]
MENNAPQKKQLPAFLILTIISVVAACVLALTNMITAGPIAEHAMAALKDAFNAVMPAETYEEMTLPADSEVSSLYAAKNGGEVIGYCVTAASNGYGGPVAVTLGVDLEGVVTGCSVGDTSFAETAGFGMRAKEASFQEQFPGISAIDGGSFEALSGATVTSEAVRASVNKGLKCVAEVALGKTQNTQVTFGAPAAKEEKPAQAPSGDVLTAAAPGFNGADVGVSVTLNGDGTIATLTLDLSQQLPPVCDLCNSEAFLGQFIGKKGPFEGVDIVTGATYTSEGIINAVNSLFAADAFASAETRTAAAPGFNGADVGVTAVLNADGTIAELAFDLSQQLPPVCDLCDTEAFKANFVGKKGPFEGVDVVTGATFTSEGIIAALNKIYAEEQPAAEAPATVIAEGENATLAVKADGAAIVTPNEGFTGEVDVKVSVEDGKVTAGEFVAPVAAEPAPVDNIIGVAQGYQSEVNVGITLAEDGSIASLSIGSADETPGFGTRCAENEAFINQFIGKKAPLAIGEGIDALSGATVTSTAVVEAINTALAAAPAAPVDATSAATDAVSAATAAATEEVKEEDKEEAAAELTAAAPGFAGADVGVTVTLDAEGNIATLTIDNSQQVPPVCDLVDTDAFKGQFIGKKGPFENIDIVTGATFTSEGVIAAVNSLFPAEEVKEEAKEEAAAELTAAAPGFAGADVGVTVTLNEDGTIATLTIDNSQQVPPVCDLVDTDAFKGQFIGKKGPFEGVDIVTGATFTSEGVIAAVNSLFPAEEVKEEAKEEAAAELTAAAPGFAGADVGVTVTLDAEGNIATLTIDNSQQVPPVCDLVDTDAFKGQFIGKKGPFENIDIVTGATFTSEGVIEALNSLFQ